MRVLVSGRGGVRQRACAGIGSHLLGFCIWFVSPRAFILPSLCCFLAPQSAATAAAAQTLRGRDGVVSERILKGDRDRLLQQQQEQEWLQQLRRPA